MELTTNSNIYEVIVQWKKEDIPRLIGSVRAPNGSLALLQAKEIFTRREKCYRLSVLPRNVMISTTDEDISLFDYAYSKEYRQPGFFSARNARRIRKGAEV